MGSVGEIHYLFSTQRANNQRCSRKWKDSPCVSIWHAAPHSLIWKSIFQSLNAYFIDHPSSISFYNRSQAQPIHWSTSFVTKETPTNDHDKTFSPLQFYNWCNKGLILRTRCCLCSGIAAGARSEPYVSKIN